MVDVPPKQSGLRAMFRKRTNNDELSRKRLTKKVSRHEANRSDKLGVEIVSSSDRQDSCSAISHRTDFTNGDRRPSTYSDSPQRKQRGYRDSPYAALTANVHINQNSTEILPAAEYRRNSEGLQQYALPLYQTQSSRSASVLPSQDEKGIDSSLSPLTTKTAPTKLTKTRRMPKADEILDKDTGERRDLTDMMHAFTFNEALDNIEEKVVEELLYYDSSKPDGTQMLCSVSPEIWLRIADFMTPLDVANLSSTCRTMYARLGKHPYKLLSNPLNLPFRLDFLLAMDHKLPRHLFCFPCAQWHLRIQPGQETLKPHNVLNPLFECPNQTNIHLPPPRMRISDGRMLPFAFVQLARRAWEFGPEFGVRYQSLARRWKDPYSNWTHESMYHVTGQGHVLMRVKSQCYVEGGMTDAAKRMLLFSRSDYTPYFSVCSHWKSGVLTSIPKCALDHIPFTPESEVYAVMQLKEKLAGKKAVGVVNLCGRCRPMRRCPVCPTEYLFELKLVEDKTVKSHTPERFKQALIATRWSDLGAGRSPGDKEWAAITGDMDDYDSFLEIGRRAISGVFESAFTDTIPGQRIISMNPKNVKADENGGDWY